MKKTMRLLSLAALALVGAVMTGCSNEDDVTVEPENKSNVVTLTTTVGIGGGAETRALTAEGVKTFAAGETMAVIYNNGTSTVKAVSHTLEAGDLIDGGRSATFTFDLETPDKGVAVTYIYPAAMANSDGSINYAALNSQNGTLATLASNLDLATYSGAWNAGSLPTGTLTNQLAILALTLKDAGGSNDITSSITRMTLKAGDNTYTVSPSSLSTIYVAIQPTASAQIWVTATDGSNEYKYTKLLTGKTYEASNGYPLSWRMVSPTTLGETFNTAGGAVKVNFNYHDYVCYCLFASNGNGTYTFLSGDEDFGGNSRRSRDLVVEDGKLVFKANWQTPITKWWDDRGYSVTFDTSNSTYSEWVGGENDDNPSFISVEVNGTTISLSKSEASKITVDDLTGLEDGRAWSSIAEDDNSDKIYIDGNYIKRLSDGAVLMQKPWWGDDWEPVSIYDSYDSSEYSYKFEGDD